MLGVDGAGDDGHDVPDRRGGDVRTDLSKAAKSSVIWRVGGEDDEPDRIIVIGIQELIVGFVLLSQRAAARPRVFIFSLENAVCKDSCRPAVPIFVCENPHR